MLRRLFDRIAHAEAAPPWTVWNAISALVAAFMSVLLGTSVTLVITRSNGQLTALLGWSIAAALIIAFILFTRRKPQEREALRLNIWQYTPASPSKTGKAITPRDENVVPPLANLFFLLLVGVGLAVTLDVITGRVTGLFLPEPELLRPYQDYALNVPISGVTWLLAVVFMIVLQPIAEGLVFQGMLLPTLRQSVGPWPGYLISAALYGLFHLMAYSQPPGDFAATWYGLIAPFFAGLIYGAVRLYTGSTRAAMLAHAAFGLFAVLKLLTLVG
ncbi:MAG: CPBP family intramembrane metalloprotease [Anaerolineae bacterium]|nr:CPBP family intramembrane metalloprotease [Anaerolineae bacterium]